MRHHLTPTRLLLLAGGAVCLFAAAAPRPTGAPASAPARPGQPSSAHPSSAHPSSAHPSSAHPSSAHPASAQPASTRSPATGLLSARAIELTETRERRLVTSTAPFNNFLTGLRVKVRLEGPAAASAAKAGRLTVAEASDDLGTDLHDPEQLKWCAQLQEVSRFNQSESDKASGAFEYELRLGLPARRATTIKRLRAELTVLAGGNEKTVALPAVRKLAGKPVDDATLKAAGLVLKILPSPAGKKDTLQAELSGEFDIIQEVKVLTPDGTNILSGTWYSEAAGRRNVTYMLSQSVEDDAARLELRIAVGQKKVVVPINLSDLPLP